MKTKREVLLEYGIDTATLEVDFNSRLFHAIEAYTQQFQPTGQTVEKPDFLKLFDDYEFSRNVEKSDEAERDKKYPYDGHQNDLQNACRSVWTEACEFKQEQLLKLLNTYLTSNNLYTEEQVRKAIEMARKYFVDDYEFDTEEIISNLKKQW